MVAFPHLLKRLIIPDIHHRTQRADLILAAEPAGEVYFLGDYQDDFFDTPAMARATAIWMRTQIEAGHKLLWGNHDLPYGFLPARHDCPGYSAEKAAAIAEVLTLEHWKRLRLWYIIEDGPRPWILSHAGIERPWLPEGVDPVPFLRQLEAEVLEGLVHAVEDGRFPYKRVEDALRRQRAAKERFLADADQGSSGSVRRHGPLKALLGCDAHRRIADEMARCL